MTASQVISLRRVLIVEDDAPGQRRLCGLLGTIVGEGLETVIAGSMADARSAANAGMFDIALVDIGLPDGNGVELIAWLQARHPRIACLVITAWGDGDTVLAALRAGAIGYLLKDRDDAELSRALQNIQRGGAPIDPFVARRILSMLPGAVPVMKPEVASDLLSGRERQILGLVAHGHNNRQIAELTGLSRFTIEDYTKRIYRKLAVGSRAAAVFEAHARGLLR
ncbi:MAG TPA: response regulator transcription factor [Rhodanobacteraceae bacterium]|nr:response regulator transcription factor [Rhodanobacteraceae bacterium]